MNLKTPAIYDIYEGEYPVKIEQMTSPKPLAVIARASWQMLGGRTRAADTRAVEYVNQCKAAGIKYGLYHFLTPNGIAEQAALFLSQWNKCSGADIAPIVDVEVDLMKSYNGTIGQQVWQNHVKTFIDLVAAGTGKTPMIYTNKNYWGFTYTRNALLQLVPPSWTADYPLWVAQYPYQPDQQATPAVLPGGWSKWAIWQYNDAGRSNGFLANDLNTVSEWYADELGDIIPPVDPPVDPPVTEFPDEVGLTIGDIIKWYVPK
jgi:hypothetical protein